MKRDYIIDSYIQQLYNCYNIPDIFLFSQERANANVWVLFMRPDDCINFFDFEPVAKEYTTIIPSTPEDVYQAIQEIAFGEMGWLLSSSSHNTAGELNRDFSEPNHPQQYAMAA